MRIKNGNTEVEIEPEDVFDALTERCPKASWGGCDCGMCEDGKTLNDQGRTFRKLFFKV